ncbi:helix-turn-helix domain-containing protein [Nocardia nova]|uniref:helix-turn-helix domain-containing protein n=1 Tax=Nocardia nova TaxID=37330 RepID=UPI003787E35C
MGNQSRWSQRVATRVRRAVKDSGIAPYRFARLTGIPKTTFDRRLDGVNPWDTEELEAIAKVLGIEPNDLIPPPRAQKKDAS